MNKINKFTIVLGVFFVVLAGLISFGGVKAQEAGLHGMDLFYSKLAEVVGNKIEVPSLADEPVMSGEDILLGYSRATKRIEYVYDFRNGINLNGNVLPDTYGTINLGSFKYPFNQIFASGTSYLDNLTVSGTLQTASTTYLSQSASTTNLTVAGYTNLDGIVYLGSATDDDILIRGRIAQDIDPKTTNTYDLGALGLAWQNIYASSTSFLDYVSSTRMEASSLYLKGDVGANANNSLDIGQYGLAFSNIFASGTVDLGGILANGQTGDITFGTSTSATITITNQLAADLDPSANNTYDLGLFGLAYKDAYVSSTLFVGDLSDLLYVDKANSRIGIATSSPSAQLAVGTGAGATSTMDLGTACFRMISDVGSVDTVVYYYPCVGDNCPTVAMAASGWATSTASCF